MVYLACILALPKGDSKGNNRTGYRYFPALLAPHHLVRSISLSDQDTTKGISSMDNDDEEYVVIKKTHLLIALMPVVFILGLLIGMLAGAYMWGGSDGVARIIGGEAEEAGPPAGAPSVEGQPSAPSRIEVSADDDPYIGPEDAPITIVEFSDFQCPYCTRFRDETLGLLLEEYGNQVRFVYRDYPLTQIHPQALGAHIAAECAAQQDMFWEMHDIIFDNQSQIDADSLRVYAGDIGLDLNAFDDCFEDEATLEEVMADISEGQSYGVRGTPTFFINGMPLVGAQPFEAFQSAIDEELAANN
jgi:protein-disulfide isomerase